MKALQNTYKDNLKIKPSKEKRRYDKKHDGYKKSSDKWNPIKKPLPNTWGQLIEYDCLG